MWQIWQFGCYLERSVIVPGVSVCVSKGIVGLESWVNYSYLKAAMGSTRMARRAGM
jgi:hypothetical protein